MLGDDLEPRVSLDDPEVRHRAQDIGLKPGYAVGLLVLLAVQMLIANAVFVAYAD
ncbi:MAG: hypothetical protein JNK12_25250 [Acidimicrobiales bacterium]|nr:hypothetical protein [Acidimicrobiales bacterium]